MNLFKSALICLAGIALTACASAPTTEEKAVAKELPPMPRPPIRDVGYSRTVLRDGEPVVSKLVSRNADLVAFESSDGCSWSRMDDPFAPSTKWVNCEPFADGTQTATRNGEVWPLTVGKTWSYSVIGQNSFGNNWRAERTCEVEEAVQIKTNLGDYDTYKVFCSDPWTDRTWYVSPELQKTVYFERYRKRQGQRMVSELTNSQ